MSAFSVPIILMVAGSIATQVVGVMVIPHTKGLTAPSTTIGMFLYFMVGVGLTARLVHTGINVSTVLPLVASVVPLASIVIGATLFEESASSLKIALVVGGCVIVLAASYLE